MDQVIWVEILSRHRDVAARLRFTGAQVRIGRGYDNDVVIDDPYVATRHMRVSRDETGRLVAEDLGSANGMFLDRDKSRHQRIVIDGERPIRIGHTWLRIRDASHAVEGERTAAPAARIMSIGLTVALGAVILAIEALSAWFIEVGEPRISHYLLPLLYVAAAIVGWVTVWTLLVRVLSGRARFERNLLIVLTGVIVFLLYNALAQYAAFALTWRTLASYDYVAMWGILAAVCFFHLREIGASRLKLKGAVMVALLALAISVQTLMQTEAFQDLGRQSTLRRLMPPTLRLVPVRDESTFFAAIEQLKASLDRDRSEVGSNTTGR